MANRTLAFATGPLGRFGPRGLLASTLASIIALTPIAGASPLGVESEKTKPTSPKVVIATKKPVTAKAGSPQAKKATITKTGAKKPAKKVAPPRRTAPKPTTTAPGAQTQRTVAPVKQPLTILVNLPAGQYFTPEMKAMGVEEMLVLYPQNFDPQSMQTAKVSGEKIVAAVKAARGENPSGWVMLDYEIPFNTVFFNGKSDPRFEPMVDSMIEGVKYAKQQLPNCRFTYYGVPSVLYYISNKGWEAMPEWARIQAHDSTMEKYLGIVKELDWLNPSVYDRFDLEKHPVAERSIIASREAKYRENVMRIADALRKAAGRPNLPIIPAVGMVYAEHGTATPWDAIAQAEFRSDQVDPSISNGADGFAMWSALDYNAWVATLAWVPTAGETARANARNILTRLLFDGSAPGSWTTPDAKSELTSRVGSFVERYVKAVREAEAAVPRPSVSAVATANGD
jgi:hypothetical protein